MAEICRKCFPGRWHLAIAGIVAALVAGMGVAPVVAQDVVSAGIVQEEVASGALVPLLQDMVKNHDRMRQAQAQVDSFREKLRSARGIYMPSVQAYGQTGYERIKRSERNDSRSTGFSGYTLEARQRVYDFGKSSGHVEDAQIKLQLAELELEKVSQDLLLEGVKAYFDAARAACRLRYARNAENNIRIKTGMEETLVHQGTVATTNALRAKKQLVGAQMTRVQREGDLLIAIHRYQSLFGQKPAGLEQGPMQTINVQFIPTSVEQAIGRAITQNIAIRRSDLHLRSSRILEGVIKANLYPDIDVVVDGNIQHDVGYLEGNQTTARALVELNVPLFSGLRDASLYKSSQYDVSGAQHAAANARRETIRDVRVAWQDLVSRKDGSELYQHQAEIVGELLRNIRQRQVLDTSQLDVVDIETDFILSVSDAINAETDMLLSAFGLLSEMGELRSETLPNLFVSIRS